jgi:undecaprenyl-diphosphatase
VAHLAGILRGADTRDRAELVLLLAALALIALTFFTFELAAEVFEGDIQRFDERVLRWFRQADEPALAIGPRWLRNAALDVTALGSASVLGLTVAGIAGFLFLQGLHRMTVFVLLASVGGWVLSNALKIVIGRPRPGVVPYLREVSTMSFPSGHALTSAAVYLTLGALLMRATDRRATKLYCMAAAMAVTLLVGTSRVYLGVHYPTDVLGGWMIGMSWALLCWMLERLMERRSGIAREKERADL